MEKFSAILSSIPLDHFQTLKSLINTLNLSAADFTFLVAIFGLVVSLLAFSRAGSKTGGVGLAAIDAINSRLEKVELSLSDIRNRYANALSLVDQEVKTLEHDVAETKKIIEIVFSKKNGVAETATEYQEYHRAASADKVTVHMRGAPIDVRISKGQD
ncbi:MAG: hypothetical protein SGJ02_04715 [bacterium]|nr:hypothetical protein [bacterium]